jgi:hypothetical protein
MRGTDRRGLFIGWLLRLFDRKKNSYYRYNVDWDRRVVWFPDREIGLEKVSSIWLTRFYGQYERGVIEVVIDGRVLREFYEGPIAKVEAMATLLEEDLKVPVNRGN